MLLPVTISYHILFFICLSIVFLKIIFRKSEGNIRDNFNYFYLENLGALLN